MEDLLPIRQLLYAMLRGPESGRREEYVEHDIKFHTAIAALAGNAVLYDVQRSLLEQLRPHLDHLEWTTERQQRTDHSHATIFAGLLAGDATAVRAEMMLHLNLAYETLLRDLHNPPTVSTQESLP